MTPDSERKVSEQEFFFFVTEGDFEDAQNVRLQRQGLLHSAPQLPAMKTNHPPRPQRHEASKIGFRNSKLKTSTM
jgi:hypothetical protein